MRARVTPIMGRSVTSVIISLKALIFLYFQEPLDRRKSPFACLSLSFSDYIECFMRRGRLSILQGEPKLPNLKLRYRS